jgi:hypothetical protein
VRRLRLQLQTLQMERQQGRQTVTGGAAARVEHWGIAMARHPRWKALPVGPPGGLRGLVEERGSQALPAELAEALRGPHSRVRWAVRAAFALHGQRAPEWLNEAPLRLVDDLLRLTARPVDQRTAALRLLGLEPGASLAAIKRAYRRLAKAHHPDLGGDVEAFHRLDAAYRLLIGSEAQV